MPGPCGQWTCSRLGFILPDEPASTHLPTPLSHLARRPASSPSPQAARCPCTRRPTARPCWPSCVSLWACQCCCLAVLQDLPALQCRPLCARQTPTASHARAACKITPQLPAFLTAGTCIHLGTQLIKGSRYDSQLQSSERIEQPTCWSGAHAPRIVAGAELHTCATTRLPTASHVLQCCRMPRAR